MGNPVHAGQDPGQVPGLRRRGVEMQHDLRLNARLDITVQPAMDLAAVALHGGVFVDAAPHGEVHAQRSPHGRVGESDLAAYRKRALGQARLVQPGRHIIGIGQVEAGISCRNGRDGQGAVLRGLDFAGERKRIE
ncbi:hypothetical protein D3C72_2120520 [compost metagenome]